ncbi:MAG: restriction endonuclease subunit S [Trueperaceae bacterium]|nr:restriction endonuclease subunit S [Trueperaceae bacterium]
MRPLYDRPSVLIGRKGTIDNPQYMETPFWTVDTPFYTELIFDQNSAKFMFYEFCTIPWRSYSAGIWCSSSLNAKTIEGIEVHIPKPDEQAAIATVLSDMDAEIEALEQRRTKTADLKQAMMQELLTGKTRLVPLEGTDA